MIYLNQRSKKTKKQKLKAKLAWETQQKKYGISTKSEPAFVALKRTPATNQREGSMAYKSAQSICIDAFDAFDTFKPAPKHYTGNKVIGIACMHKSNLVPIFSQEEAINVATMRRG